MNDFNNNLLGKAVNFLSVASPFIGPDPGGSMKEMMVSGYSKTTVLSLLKGAEYHAVSLDATPGLTLAGIGGELIEAAAEEVALPAVAVATISAGAVKLSVGKLLSETALIFATAAGLEKTYSYFGGKIYSAAGCPAAPTPKT